MDTARCGDGAKSEFYHVDEGIRFDNGVARLRVEPSQIIFEQFEAKGIEGTLSVKGTVGWGAGQTQGVKATMVMNQLRPFARPDREVVLSGTADLGFDGVRVLDQGNIKVDKASLICRQPAHRSWITTCVLSKRPVRKPKPREYAAETDINVNLGDRFPFQRSWRGCLSGRRFARAFQRGLS